MVIVFERRHWWFASALVMLLVLAFWLNRQEARFLPADRVWAAVRVQGAMHDLDPRFIFAIAMAESSLNASADSGFARGLMQLSRSAWQDASELDYRQAFAWRTNLRVGSRYLAHLRDRLAESGHFDYSRLAAAYRYGYGALAEAEFAVDRLPPPENTIYRTLFSGEIPEPPGL